MRKILPAALAIALIAVSAQAQPRGGKPPGGPPPSGDGGGPPPAGAASLDKVVLTGMVLAIDPEADRVTIAYDPCEPLGWPAGTMPFAMAKAGLLGDLKVRDKVRFRLENHRIAEFLPPPPPGGDKPGNGPGPGPGGPPPPR